MSKESLDRAVARLSARQHGVFAREQVVALGATKAYVQRRLQGGMWIRVFPGVYRIAAAPTSWSQRAMAATLAGGASSVLSYRAAAAMWQLPGFVGPPVEISVPRGGSRPRGFTVHRVALAKIDCTRIRGIPTTTVARTLIDLASVEPFEVVEDAVDDALRRELVTLDRLRRRVGELTASGRGGFAAIRAAVERTDGDAVPQSVFETRLARLIRRSGLPEPRKQHRIAVGARSVIVDLAYPEHRVAIEADGYRWHTGRNKWRADLARRNALTALGWQVVHVTWPDLANPASVIDHLTSLLSMRSSRR